MRTAARRHKALLHVSQLRAAQGIDDVRRGADVVEPLPACRHGRDGHQEAVKNVPTHTHTHTHTLAALTAQISFKSIKCTITAGIAAIVGNSWKSPKVSYSGRNDIERTILGGSGLQA